MRVMVRMRAAGIDPTYRSGSGSVVQTKEVHLQLVSH